MIRSGSTDQLLESLATGDTLRLRNISGQHWEGYSPPSNLGSYAQYLDSRIKVWRDLRHDLVKVQTESNRRSDGLGAGSKARRLRHLSVEKGLLREVKGVQRILDTLVQCKFYDDDLRDENTVLAFRMIIKDLLVLFQAGNEGVCNILEHYFEMTKQDATESFEIYKYFIKQTDRVVDFLGIARKLHNVVNVPVPNLKHAPTGLVKALEEYLNDPNFEDNRREYRASLGVVEGRGAGRTPSPAAANKDESKGRTSPVKAGRSSSPVKSPSPAPFVPPPGTSQKIQDFFDSLTTDHQPTIFGGPAQPFPQQTQLQMQAPFNPFRQSIMMPQQTGFMQPQATGFPGGHLQPQMTGQMAFGNHPSFQQNGSSPFIQPQQTGMFQPQAQHSVPFLQDQFQPGTMLPQATGSNPFRQSTMMFGQGHPTGVLSQPTSPIGGQSTQINRPGSTPATGGTAQLGQAAATTGKNPFAPAGGVPVQKPKESAGPSMNELAWNKAQGQLGVVPQQTGASPWATVSGKPTTGFNPQPTGNSPWASFNGKPSTPSSDFGPTGISDIASSFAVDSSKQSSSSDFLSQFGSFSVNSNVTGTGATSTSTLPTQFGSQTSSSPAPTSPIGGLQPQPTGFGGSTVKKFQPTSSFGSQLLESLPTVNESAGSTNQAQNQSSNGSQSSSGPFGQQQPNGSSNGASGFSGSSLGPFGQQSTGSGAFGQSTMQPQATGLPNPFRQSTLGAFGQTTNGPNQPIGAFGQGTPFGGQNRTGGGSFGNQALGGGSMAFGNQQQNTGQNQSQNAFQGGPFGQAFGGGQQQQHQQGGSSLI
ncbi:hypothetical protein BD324DRAFT_4560 [Kockovaella imperatae]|uniref:AP180 N-terminal homology (ANTH) domain-containing protein n=1 Tax=Kockovaella imperatae TaxID=4999 RepID=A0A1Y1US99_9TREE|nr:hypothetical protein BD324DRAFT_4560 [Kockovaella imperatae]ORX40507.1 hypothetical protein BD324DRAFT_4560 [Kockovaella imperatae]